MSAEAEVPLRTESWLAARLPAGPDGESILADLREEFEEVAAARGPAAARRWYRREAITLGGTYASARLMARLGRGGHAGRPRAIHQPQHWGEMMSSIMADVRFGFRMLLKTPMLSVVATLTVALGVGLTTLTYSIVDGAALRGLPVPDADRLRVVQQIDASTGEEFGYMSLREYTELARARSGFEGLGATSQGTANLAGDGGPPERFEGAFVSANALGLLGVPPLLGRSFRPGEDLPGEPSRVILSHSVWQTRFAADPSVVGTSLRINGETAEVVGVMPEGFRFPFQADLWLPHRRDPDAPAPYWVQAFGRHRADLSPAAADESLRPVAVDLAARFPEDQRDLIYRSVPYAEEYMPRQITAVLYLMLAATVGVLLIACANVANLLLARATGRAREVAIRTAMGASRSRILRQILAEALVLTTLGGVLGMGLAYLGVEAFSAWVMDIEKPYWIAFRVDAPALAFALAATVLAGLAAGLVPALRASGFGVNEVLKDEGRGASSLRLGRFSTALVVTEIAVSCGLLIASGMMIRSIVNLNNVDMGFESSGVLTGRVGLFESDYPDAGDRRAFFEELERSVEGLPGVRAAGLASQLPGLGGSRWTITVDGEEYATPRDHPTVNGSMVTSGFFDAVGVGVLRGRDFTPTESWSEEEALAIVNESFVRVVLGGRDPLGMRVRLGGAGGEAPFARIVGVVPDLYVGGNVGGIGDDQVRPEHLYLQPGPYDSRFLSVLLRTDGDPTALAPELRRTVTALDANLPVYDVASLDRAISDATWAFSMFGSLFTIFGAAALFMAAVGLYGVMSFSVSQRRQEMGVRIALGAGSTDIIGMVLRRSGTQVAGGIALGLGLGYAMAKPLSVVTFDVGVFDPVVYGTIVGTLALTGLLATWAPARSATRADPVAAMRPG